MITYIYKLYIYNIYIVSEIFTERKTLLSGAIQICRLFC